MNFSLSKTIEILERSPILVHLQAKQLSATDLQQKGMHTALGETTLACLLATWAVYNLNHITQMSRVMAAQYKTEPGPWQAYLKIRQTGN